MTTSKLINYTTREFVSENELELYAAKQDDIFTPDVVEQFKNCVNGDDYESAIKSWGKSRIPVYFFPLFLISCFIFFRNIYKNFKNPFFLGIFSIMLLSVLAASSTCRLEMRFFLPSSLLLFLILFYQKFNKLHEFKYKLLIIFILLQNVDYYTFGSNQMYYSTFYDKRPLVNLIKK